ncbi:MAG: hypothetical protein IT318_17380 [Anaerolineales bacterium]|nr:hypothetical protein [Anaerolineales bacterium]
MAWRLYPWHRAQAPGSSQPALGAAWSDGLIAVAGSVLVASHRTGWYLAGLVTTLGYTLLGLWLLALIRPAQRSWPGRAAWFSSAGSPVPRRRLASWPSPASCAA